MTILLSWLKGKFAYDCCLESGDSNTKTVFPVIFSFLVVIFPSNRITILLGNLLYKYSYVITCKSLKNTSHLNYSLRFSKSHPFLLLFIPPNESIVSELHGFHLHLLIFCIVVTCKQLLNLHLLLQISFYITFPLERGYVQLHSFNFVLSSITTTIISYPSPSTSIIIAVLLIF